MMNCNSHWGSHRHSGGPPPWVAHCQAEAPPASGVQQIGMQPAIAGCQHTHCGLSSLIVGGQLVFAGLALYGLYTLYDQHIRKAKDVE
eukprot:CAMPEP_0196720302 /NCGR_PEP_ID=MMETSP1091-20130531/3122_1 /TAXON_ID=302021 /ORGANISM="Rhodomonas sp., Strain CCMP768" /LENGTH=87 /DNA_ID=CAMNT_0042061483 /DNA_START=32 /DNA_END=295 /DNA_ORIENTATION=-